MAYVYCMIGGIRNMKFYQIGSDYGPMILEAQALGEHTVSHYEHKAIGETITAFS